MDKVIVIGCRVPGLAIVRALADKNYQIIAMTLPICRDMFQK